MEKWRRTDTGCELKLRTNMSNRMMTVVALSAVHGNKRGYLEVTKQSFKKFTTLKKPKAYILSQAVTKAFSLVKIRLKFLLGFFRVSYITFFLLLIISILC